MGNRVSVPFKVFNETLEEKKAVEQKTSNISKLEALVQSRKLTDDVFIETRNSTVYLVSGDGTVYCSLPDNECCFYNKISVSKNHAKE